MKKSLVPSTLIGGFVLNQYFNSQKLARADTKYPYLKSASVLNPKFDKRHKDGEDALLVRSNFICVLDGVGGWADSLVDPGKMTKEFISHVRDLYD